MGLLKVPVVRAEKVLKPVRSGSSRPLLLRLEDGRVAHAKFQHNPQSTRSLAYDLIGTRLGDLVGAPVPEVVLVDIPHEAIEKLPYLTKYRWRPGLQFATVYYEGSHAVSKDDIAALTNLADLPLAALFEAWLFNHDVKFSHLLTVPDPSPRFLLIDHGFILGGPFLKPSALWPRRDDFPFAKPFTAMAVNAPYRFQFADALARLAHLDFSSVTEILEETPREWGLRAREQEDIAAFLQYRLQKIEQVAKHLEALWNGSKPPDIPVLPTADAPSVRTDAPAPALSDDAAEDWIVLSQSHWPAHAEDLAHHIADEEGTPHGATDPDGH
ncbi:MAG: hypothetical protein OWU84_06550 [Firmicutes bacterium]|nr:hypothetical protein [Bacillota bacterium]